MASATLRSAYCTWCIPSGFMRKPLHFSHSPYVLHLSTCSFTSNFSLSHLIKFPIGTSPKNDISLFPEEAAFSFFPAAANPPTLLPGTVPACRVLCLTAFDHASLQSHFNSPPLAADKDLILVKFILAKAENSENPLIIFLPIVFHFYSLYKLFWFALLK